MGKKEQLTKKKKKTQNIILALWKLRQQKVNSRPVWATVRPNKKKEIQKNKQAYNLLATDNC